MSTITLLGSGSALCAISHALVVVVAVSFGHHASMSSASAGRRICASTVLPVAPVAVYATVKGVLLIVPRESIAPDRERQRGRL
jgi:hypothetical protein